MNLLSFFLFQNLTLTRNFVIRLNEIIKDLDTFFFIFESSYQKFTLRKGANLIFLQV